MKSLFHSLLIAVLVSPLIAQDSNSWRKEGEGSSDEQTPIDGAEAHPFRVRVVPD
jgi:hypothetical protein